MARAASPMADGRRQVGRALRDGDVDRLVDDPPLPFFVLFEAEQAAHGATPGPIGSIIVAETVYGALRTNVHGFEGLGPTLRRPHRSLRIRPLSRSGAAGRHSRRPDCRDRRHAGIARPFGSRRPASSLMPA
jgi:hypothetical protein